MLLIILKTRKRDIYCGQIFSIWRGDIRTKAIGYLSIVNKVLHGFLMIFLEPRGFLV